ALRRYGTYWKKSDPEHLVWDRAAGAPYQLCRPDGAPPRPAGPRRQPLLQARSGLGDFPARAARDGSDHHRQPSDHYGLVLADAPGDAARVVPRLAHPPDLGRGIWPNLCSFRELDDD